MQQRKWTARDVMTLLLVASMTSTACSSGCRSNAPASQTGGAAAGHAASAPVAAPEPAPTATRPSLSEQGAVSPGDAKAEQALKQLQAALKNIGSAIDPATLDVRAAQEKLGSDPKALTAFVTSQIGYEPYAAVLRGARGTLLARSGNAIDRAMLLAELLRAAGRTVRFAQGELTPGQAEQVVRRTLTARRASAAAGPLVEAITARARAQFFHLGNAMFDGGLTAPQGDDGRWAAAVQAARAHSWVQVSDRSGWIDLDPTPGVEYGRAATAAAGLTDAPAADQFHTVQFKIEVEIVSGGKAARRTVLTHDLRTADVAGLPLGLVHVRTSETAQPVLFIGTELINGTAFPGPPRPSEAGFAFNFGSVFQPSERPTAEWLSIRTSGTGGERTATYDIFDIVGPRKRADAALPADQTVDDERAISKALGSVNGIAILTGGLPVNLALSILSQIPDFGDQSSVVSALAAAGFAYQSARQRVPASLIDAAALIADGPGVVIASSNGGEIGLDLTLKRYVTLRDREDRLALQGPFYDMLSAGVLDHTVERWLLDPTFRAAAVGLLFEAAASQNLSIRILGPAVSMGGTGLTSDGEQRVSDASNGGATALLLEAKPAGWSAPAGWWTVDPVTGWTEDTDEHGRHTANERAWHARWIQWVRNACTSAKVSAVLLHGASLYSGDPGWAHGLDAGSQFADAAGTLCGAAGQGGGAAGRASAGAGGGPPPPPPPVPKGGWLPK